MAAAVASSHMPQLGKMKRPPSQHITTSAGSSRPSNPSASPSSAAKRLPNTASAINNTPNGVARPTRRPHRVQTRITDGGPGAERRTALKDPEPYVPSESYILKKYRGNGPSLIIHLHATHFRFDGQDASFSYQSEMRYFIEHLQRKTVPHDMLEELRREGVKFYDGWLIVKIIDHKSVAKAAATTGVEAEDEKPFSIHNYNTFITPSPYVPYPKQQSTIKSPVMKQELGVTPVKHTNGDHASSSTLGEPGSDDAARPSSKLGKPQPKTFHVALRPTNLSKHMDMVLASMELDPKSSLNRKQSQVFNARTPGSAGTMAPPLSLDTSAAGDKGLPSKKRKLRIAPDQMIHFERAVTNHTAPPLCLDLVQSLEEADAKMLMLRDPMYDQQPPSPKSRKRTVAELAADDALAKEQERFMLIMTGDGGGAGANAGVVDGQAAAAMFQPDFGKFNTIQQIKFQTAEKQKRDEERRMHDDANKRLQEEERKRHQEVMRLQQQQAQQQQAERHRHIQLQEQKRQAAAAQQQQQLQMQQQAQAQQQAQQNAQQMAQLSGVPPNMQNQMRQGQPMSSPVMRQSTPHGNSSPIMNNGQPQAIPMATQGSQQGMAGSPPRPGSAMQHGHPGVPMARGPSNQGPSRNGTPQIPQNTPAMRQATPVMRQGTPSQRMSQASPHPGMMAPTPQMQQAQMMAPGQQMQNGMPYPQTAQQLVMQQQRNHAMQQAAMQQGMMAGNPGLAQAHMAHMQAQRHANANVANVDQQAALLQHRQRQAQAAAHQAQLHQAQQQQQIGTPQQTAPSPANSAQHAQNQYSQNLRNQLQNQMQQVANHGSPAPAQGQPTPQQQMAQLHRQQAQQAGQMNPQMGQPGMPMNPQQQAMMRNAQMQQMQQAQFAQMNPQQQAQMQQMMLQQRAQAQSQMSPQQLAAMQQQQAQAQAQAQQRPQYPPQIQANMAKIRDQRIIHHTSKLANDRYGGNMQMIQPNEQQDIKRMALQDAQTWARKWQATNQAGQRAAMMAQQQANQQAQQQQMGGLPGQQQQQ